MSFTYWRKIQVNMNVNYLLEINSGKYECDLLIEDWYVAVIINMRNTTSQSAIKNKWNSVIWRSPFCPPRWCKKTYIWSNKFFLLSNDKAIHLEFVSEWKQLARWPFLAHFTICDNCWKNGIISNIFYWYKFNNIFEENFFYLAKHSLYQRFMNKS